MGVAAVSELTVLSSVISCPLCSPLDRPFWILPLSLRVGWGSVNHNAPHFVGGCSIRNHSYDPSQRKKSPISGGLSPPVVPRLLGKHWVLPLDDVPADKHVAQSATHPAMTVPEQRKT